MCIKIDRINPNPTARAFTLVEVLMATSITTITLIGLLGGISYGFSEIKLSRESLRATQVILEKMEGIRLYTFDQLVSSNMVPATFTASYYPLGTSVSSSQSTTTQSQVGTTGTYVITTTPTATGQDYYGQFSISDPGTTAGYNSNLRLITVSVYWTNSYGSSRVTHNRQMQTLVGRYGVQNYTFFN